MDGRILVYWPVSPQLWSTLKSQQLLDRLPFIFSQILMVPREYFLMTLATRRSKFLLLQWNTSAPIESIGAKFGTDIYIPLRLNCKNFGHPLTFCLAPPSGQSLSNTFIYDQIPVKLMTITLPVILCTLCFVLFGSLACLHSKLRWWTWYYTCWTSVCGKYNLKETLA